MSSIHLPNNVILDCGRLVCVTTDYDEVGALSRVSIWTTDGGSDPLFVFGGSLAKEVLEIMEAAGVEVL